MVTNLLLALLPIVCYVLLSVSSDTFQICRRRLLILAAAYGILSAIVAGVFGAVVHPTQGWVMPVAEEFLKGGLLLALSGRRRIGFFAEGITYGATIGAGFALVENVLYVTLGDGIPWLAALVRGFSTALLHIGCTALAGALSVIIVRELKDKRGHNPWGIILLSCLPSVLLHSLHNQMLIHPFLQMIIVIVVFLAVLSLLHRYDERLIAHWLDHMMEGELTLLQHIQEGSLPQTQAGQYLIALRDRFSPEEIADIIACLILHLKLAVAAKCRIMLQEAQMAPPLTQQQRQLYRAQLAELHEANRRIGPRGRAALSQIVTIHAFDQHIASTLLRE